MTSKTAPNPAAEKQKLLTEIADAQHHASATKKIAKEAKAAYRLAREKFKAAKRTAKKSKKVVKALKAELMALSKLKAVTAVKAKASPKKKKPSRAAKPKLAKTEPITGGVTTGEMPPTAPASVEAPMIQATSPAGT